MKKIILAICGAAMIGVSAVAQVQDTSDLNQQNPLIGDRPIQDGPAATRDQSQNMQDQNAQKQADGVDDQSQGRGSGNGTESQTSPAQIQAAEEGSNVDPSTERPNEMTPVEGKVGPNGEAIFRENGKYFYMNKAGEKVKIKKSALHDKTE